MEVLQNFKSLFFDVWKKGISGINISEIMIALLIFLFFLLFVVFFFLRLPLFSSIIPSFSSIFTVAFIQFLTFAFTYFLASFLFAHYVICFYFLLFGVLSWHHSSQLFIVRLPIASLPRSCRLHRSLAR